MNGIQVETEYYQRHWPTAVKPHRHLEPYFSCWLDAEAVFGGRRVLDIGAGESEYTRLIAERFSPRFIVASDLLVQRMQPAASHAPTNGLSYVCADCFRLPFADASFDVVVGTLVLCQIRELSGLCAEVSRVLRPKGCYVGIEPCPYSAVHLYRYFRGRHSPNQYLLTARHLKTFSTLGFSVNTRYFYPPWKHLHVPFLASCLGFVASR